MGGVGGWKRQQGGRDVLIMHSGTWEVWWNGKWFDLWRLTKQPIDSSISAVNQRRHVPAPCCLTLGIVTPSPALSHLATRLCSQLQHQLGVSFLYYTFLFIFFYFFCSFLQNTVTIASTTVFGHCPACHHCPLSGGAAALGLTVSCTLDCQ